MNYFFCTITEHLGDYEFSSNFLTTVVEGENLEYHMSEIARNFRGIPDDNEEDEDSYWSDNICWGNPNYKEVLEQDYETLDKFLPTL